MEDDIKYFEGQLKTGTMTQEINDMIILSSQVQSKMRELLDETAIKVIEYDDIDYENIVTRKFKYRIPFDVSNPTDEKFVTKIAENLVEEIKTETSTWERYDMFMPYALCDVKRCITPEGESFFGFYMKYVKCVEDNLKDYRKAVVERWEPIVILQKGLDKNQRYILSQLLENVQRESEKEEYITEKDMTILVPLTCQVFENIVNDLPDTYPMVGPVGVTNNKEGGTIGAIKHKLKSGKLSFKLCEEFKKVFGGRRNEDAELVNIMYQSISDEIKEQATKNDVFYPYILIQPHQKEGLKQLYMRYGEPI